MGAKPDNCAGQDFVCVKQLTRRGKAQLAFNFLLISFFEIPIHSVNLDPTPSTTTQMRQPLRSHWVEHSVKATDQVKSSSRVHWPAGMNG